ncbi:MAG: hypothetical protein J6R42_05985 [Clostridia bacterium]|nr:hypothetical protein [Clostridia bacterium]
MNKLLKVDMKRICKDKLLLVVSIIGLGFGILMPIIFKLLFTGLGVEDIMDIGMDAKFFLFNSFSPSNNFGIILPVFLCIIVCKDFSHGTIRNKIICGHKRSHIFLSMFISVSTYLTAIIMLYGLLNFAMSFAVGFKYSAQISFAKDLGYLLLSLLFVVMAYVFLSAVISFLVVFTKNVGAAIVLNFALTLCMTMIISVLEVVVLFGTMSDGNETLLRIVDYALKVNPFYMLTMVIGKGVEYSTKEVLCFVFSTILYVTGLVLWGSKILTKKELK